MAQAGEFYLPDDLYYDRKDHLWAKVEGQRVRVGLDQFGQKAAGTVAYIKLLPLGRPATKGRAFGSLEAGKYIGPLKAPVNGRIAEVNAEVVAEPKRVNTDPYNSWFVVIEASNLPADLSDLVQGPDIQTWLDQELKEYREKGLIKD